MALFKSKKGFRLTSVVLSASLSALSPAVVASGCSGKDGPAVGVGEPAPAAAGVSAAYRTVDRIEAGASYGEAVAVLEDMGTLRTEERSVKDLPAGVEEGQVLTDGGVAGGSLWIDNEETVTRAARIGERFKRLKAD